MDIQVNTAARKQKRDIKNRLNRNILKHIAEIVLNSDDSYKRIETLGGLSIIGLIKVSINSQKRLITITDCAEGMTKTQLQEIFSTYGADNNRREVVSNVRGLFGQGASDVMFASAIDGKSAFIKTIKDGIVSDCTFFINKDTQQQTIRVREVELSRNRLESLRRNLGIPVNGTFVQFELPDDVKIPKRLDLEKQFKAYPYFRYILANPHRQMMFDYDSYSTQLMIDLSTNDQVIIHHEGMFSFEEQPIHLSLKLYQRANSSIDGVKILVEDEHHVVYDNRFFGYEKHLGSSFIWGILTISGFSQFLSVNLNSNNPREIITSTRDGFKTDDDFYLALVDSLDPILKKAFKDFEKTYQQKDIDISSNKNVSKALREMNKSLSELQSDTIPGESSEPPLPTQGLQFARNSISISIDKTYTLPLYINTELIPIGSVITFIPSSLQRFRILARSLLIKEEDVKPSGLAIKTVIISAGGAPTIISETIQALTSTYTSQVNISIVDKNIHYPPNGIDFYPNLTTFVPNSPHKLHLYVDLNVIPIGSNITLTDDGKGQLRFDRHEYQINKQHYLDDNIAQIDITCEGGFIGDRFKVSAECLLFSSYAVFSIVENQSSNSSLTKGLFNQIKLQRSDSSLWQSRVEGGTILINLSNPIAKKNMKDIEKLTPNDTVFSDDDLPYIYEMIASESSKLSVNQDITLIGDNQLSLEKYEEKKSEFFAKINKVK